MPKRMSSFERSKLKTKKMKSSNLKLAEKSRKQIRKESRMQKKVNRVNYLKKRKELRARAHATFKNVEFSDSENKIISDEIIGKARIIQNKSEKHAKENKKRKLEELERKRKNKKKQLLKQANLQEDKMIKKLGKQLKLNKRKKDTIPKSFIADGLDYLLNFCLEKDRKHIVESKKEFIENELNNESSADSVEMIEADTLYSSEIEDKNENEDEKKNEIKNERKNENEDNDSDAITDETLMIEISGTTKMKLTEIKKDGNMVSKNGDFWEDIYGRKRDKEGNIVADTNKYVPPAARIAGIHNTSLVDEKLCLIKKQLKGCLNRVTEHNMHSITNQIESMYMTNSRNNMNYVLSELILESLVSHVLTPSRLISEHTMLIAILHANIGIEVGANFLEKLVKRFVEIMKEPQDVENKELDNVILMISYLYNFKVFGNKLLYQVLERLMVKFTEKEIELILLVLKTVGFSLRKDDPNALKEFIQNLQSKASHENGKNLRVRYMLDILLAIKNNNINKIPQYDPSHLEHLRKIMKGVIRKGNIITQFNVSLEDLLHADENGKWWIVGSAWSGSTTMNNKENVKGYDKLNFGKNILELAQKQRMNTDARKNIFCILMTAEDYLDAFEKLHHLGLKHQQEGEIIHVLIHCCLQEKKFNPYYAVLAQKLCEYNRKYQLMIQYTFWDKLKTLESYGQKQLSNLAKFLTHLLIERCLVLSILKIIPFTELDKHTMKFLRQIFLEILLHKNEQACVQVFERISVSPHLHTFRESLRLFINCFLIKSVDSYSILENQKVTLKRRAELVDKILILHGSKVVF